MIADRYLNPTIREWGVNVLAFTNPDQDAARGVTFTHSGLRPLFTREGLPSVFTNQATRPLFGDDQI